jgi:hypothetical protein
MTLAPCAGEDWRLPEHNKFLVVVTKYLSGCGSREEEQYILDAMDFREKAMHQVDEIIETKKLERPLGQKCVEWDHKKWTESHGSCGLLFESRWRRIITALVKREVVPMAGPGQGPNFRRPLLYLAASISDSRDTIPDCFALINELEEQKLNQDFFPMSMREVDMDSEEDESEGQGNDVESLDGWEFVGSQAGDEEDPEAIEAGTNQYLGNEQITSRLARPQTYLTLAGEFRDKVLESETYGRVERCAIDMLARAKEDVSELLARKMRDYRAGR